MDNKNIKDELKEIWRNAKLKIEENKSRKEQDNKYKNHRLNIDGVKYDSEREYYRLLELQLLEKYNLVSNVKFHAKEDVLKIITNPDVRYIPDFTYYDHHGNFIIEDTKGMQTADFIIKKKLVVSKIRSGEYPFTLKLTKKYKDGFESIESYSKDSTYIRPKKKKKQRSFKKNNYGNKNKN